MTNTRTIARLCVILALTFGGISIASSSHAGQWTQASPGGDDLEKAKKKYEKKKKEFDKKVREAMKIKSTQPTKRKKKLEEVRKVGAELRAIKALIDKLEADTNGEGEGGENSKTELTPYGESDGGDDEAVDEDSDFDGVQEQAWDESEEESDESESFQDEIDEDFDESHDDSSHWDDEAPSDDEL